VESGLSFLIISTTHPLNYFLPILASHSPFFDIVSVMSFFVDLAFPIEVNKLFTYSVPLELQDAIQPGVRALAPFGKKTAVGFVVNSSRTSHFRNPRLRPTGFGGQVKSIHDVLDDRPIISDELLRLTRWISEYYFAPWGEVLKTALPPGLAKASKRTILLQDHVTEEVAASLSGKKAEILQLLLKKRRMTINQLQKHLKKKSIYSLVHSLVHEGFVSTVELVPSASPKIKMEKVIEITDSTKSRWTEWNETQKVSSGDRRSKQLHIIEALLQHQPGHVAVRRFLKDTGSSISNLRPLIEQGVVVVSERETIRSQPYELYDAALGQQNIRLTQHQVNALQQIVSAVRENRYHTFLLHGVTGSGKTQVYIEAIREVLVSGKSAIVLVPEISLTPQIVRRFKFQFGEKVTVLHSKMSTGERYDSWRLTREGRYSIVIGPRSAVFAPVKNLGLIVVDEEQEATYKQFDQTPRYHARDVAIMRANLANATVLLGSATPSVESYYNALQGKYTLLELPERVDNAHLPKIHIVDMTAERKKKLEQFREERKAEFKANPVTARLNKRKIDWGTISDLLQSTIDDRLTKQQGIILLQNRRGFAPFLECLDCGFVEMCDNCTVTLTYHLTKRQLRCHYCGFSKSPPDTCPRCRGANLHLQGIGTQRVEEELKRLFPRASIVRMDLDTTVKKGSHDTILRQFAEGKHDILLGTQMVAKGLDFSRVTLVGVVSADIQMLLPDFRSAERVFQLLTQVAGRAGRSGALHGEVIIQTSQPQHYALKHVVAHDFQEFYREELQYRQELDYPPYSRIVLIELKGERENEVMRHAEWLAKLLKSKNTHFITLGPAPAAIPKLKGNFRWHIVIKNLRAVDPAGKHLHAALAQAVKSYKDSALGKSKRVKIIIDVDPVGMM
jgi:primosomal protein N' (replication factor Y)